MKDFNIEISYSIISAIRAGISESIPEIEKIEYNIDTAVLVFKETNCYSVIETIKFIESRIDYYNAGGKLRPYKIGNHLRSLCPSKKHENYICNYRAKK